MTRYVMVADINRCVGCQTCTAACKHTNATAPGVQWRKVLDFEVGTYPDVRRAFIPVGCNHCLDAPCADVCPTGATLFGTRKELLAEAKKRLAAKSGEVYTYPRGRASDELHTHEKVAPTYQQHIYGEHEVGGTQVMHIAGVPLKKLGMPELPDRSYASIAEGVQHTLYKGMIAPAIALAGLAYVVKRNTSNSDQDDE
ncbi:MAG: hydrogenase 2 protein HybA, partial [Sedimenticola sp.]|nr:hydrogenase 2 protein HybA [Sedimenticola sp.]